MEFACKSSVELLVLLKLADSLSVEPSWVQILGQLELVASLARFDCLSAVRDRHAKTLVIASMDQLSSQVGHQPVFEIELPFEVHALLSPKDLQHVEDSLVEEHQHQFAVEVELSHFANDLLEVG